MSKEIGRNDPCICGSGKKYKKCCIDKANQFKQPMSQKPSLNLFNKYNSTEILSVLAALHLVSENHGNHSGIEQLTIKTIQNFQIEEQQMDSAGLDNLKTEFAALYQEDAVDGLYTELLPYHGGDKLILTGGSEQIIFSLNQLISTVVYADKKLFPDAYRRKVLQATELLLTLSDLALKRAGLVRYLEGNNVDGELHIPLSSQLNKLKQAVIFSQKFVFDFLKELGTSKDVFDEFLLDRNDPALSEEEEGEELIRHKPLMITQQGFVLISPAAIGYALHSFFISEAKRLGCYDQLKTIYEQFLWQSLQIPINVLGFKRIDELSGEVSGAYRFDDDKIAVIHLSGENTDDLYQEIKNNQILCSNHLLDISLLADLNQDTMYPLFKLDHAESLAMYPEELFVFAKTKDTDALDLFKFAIADAAPANRYFPTFASFIDRFFFYRKNDDSFYTERENRRVIPQILPGYGIELHIKARKKDDIHLAVMPGNGNLQLLEVFRKDRLIPLYYSPILMAQGKLLLLVEEYPQPIWVTPANLERQADAALRHMFFEMGDAIAYWLVQLQPFLFNYLKYADKAPIKISYSFIDNQKFAEPERNFQRVDNLLQYFKHAVSGQEIELIIPTELLPYLYGGDNDGERELVMTLILLFNTFLEQSGLPVIPEAQRQIFVDGAAPRGNKKKVYILDTGDNIMLDPSNLAGARYIQEYDISVVLDKIVELLGNPKAREFTIKKEKNDFANDIVYKALMPFLRQRLNQYEQSDLITRLIRLNEALTRKREILRIQTPTRIACFVSVEQQEDELLEETELINRTTIAVRALIEQVAAEAPHGNQPLSTAAMDELIAIADQIISWGSVSDQVKFDLLHIGLAILPSGRVGSDKATIRNVFDPFHAVKTKENVQNAIDSYQLAFPQRFEERGQPLPANLNQAFKADYKISLERLMDFIQALIATGFGYQDACVCKPLNGLLAVVNGVLKDHLTPRQFDAAIEYLGLVDRGSFNQIPAWADESDIQPWRFNKRISFLRKPLIITGLPGEEQVWWGIRHLAQSRIYLADQMQTGRFKGLKGGNVVKILGKMANERGADLVDHLLTCIDQTKLTVDRDVFIRPAGKLINPEDLGDIDILIIDPVKKILFSLECKSMAPSRNIREMSGEIDKFFGDGDEKGWVDRHQERHEWLMQNLAAVGELYDHNLAGFSVKSFLVTEEAMLTPHLRGDNLPFPFLTRYDFDKLGIKALEV